MAHIIHAGNSKEADITDGTLMRDTCEQQLDIPFACKDGVCGTCKVKVVEGMENLSPKNDKENDMGLEDNQRLMCQTTINSGTVKIDEPL